MENSEANLSPDGIIPRLYLVGKDTETYCIRCKRCGRAILNLFRWWLIMLFRSRYHTTCRIMIARFPKVSFWFPFEKFFLPFPFHSKRPFCFLYLKSKFNKRKTFRKRKNVWLGGNRFSITWTLCSCIIDLHSDAVILPFDVKSWRNSCNHMTCTVCEVEFCWLCLQEITDLHYLR